MQCVRLHSEIIYYIHVMIKLIRIIESKINRDVGLNYVKLWQRIHTMQRKLMIVFLKCEMRDKRNEYKIPALNRV